nr:hypothetical protein [Pseudomonas aeruginosa]
GTAAGGVLEGVELPDHHLQVRLLGGARCEGFLCDQRTAGQYGQAASAKGLMWSVHGESLADQGAISLPIALIPFRKKYSARVRGIFYEVARLKNSR